MGLATKHHVFQVRHAGGYQRAEHPSVGSTTQAATSPMPLVLSSRRKATREGVGGAGVPVRRRNGSALAERRPALIFQGPRRRALFSPSKRGLADGAVGDWTWRVPLFAVQRPGDRTGMHEQENGWQELGVPCGFLMTREPVALIFFPAETLSPGSFHPGAPSRKRRQACRPSPYRDCKAD